MKEHPDFCCIDFRTGRCKVCHRKLTNAGSVKFGIGPVCFTRYPELANVESEEEADQVLEEIREREEGQSTIFKTDDEDVPENLEEQWSSPLRSVSSATSRNDTPPPASMTIDIAKSQLSNYTDKDWRPNQKEAIEFILNSRKKFIFIEAPTGAGKSLLAMVAGKMKEGVTYSVHSKVLQHQITYDFPEALSLFGRSNYKCQGNPDDNATCDGCLHTQGAPCESRGCCFYLVQKKRVEKAELRILNYDYLLAAANYANSFTNSQFNIVDEADNLEGTLIEFVTLTFTGAALDRLNVRREAELLKKTSKDKGFLLDSWKAFAKNAGEECGRRVAMFERQIEDFRNPLGFREQRIIKDKVREQRLFEKINLFLNNVDRFWIYDDRQEDKWIFRPLWLTPELAELYMWRHAKQWVLMSASFLPIMLECKRLGISLEDVDYLSIPSTFPIERRPIHIESAANLTHKTMEEELPKLVARTKEIITSHSDVKGLIHAVSYKLADAIMNGIKSNRFLVHNSKNRQDVLNKFINSSEPLILISPSMDRGVSLEQDLCRFIIVAKAPFLYLGDRIVSARVHSSKMGQEWFTATMLLTVLQMTGRGMRSADDFCETYILDEQFKRALESKPTYLPRWWKESIVWE